MATVSAAGLLRPTVGFYGYPPSAGTQIHTFSRLNEGQHPSDRRDISGAIRV